MRNSGKGATIQVKRQNRMGQSVLLIFFTNRRKMKVTVRGKMGLNCTAAVLKYKGMLASIKQL